MNKLIEKYVYKQIRDYLIEEFKDLPYEGGERLRLDPKILEKVIFEKDPINNKKIFALPGEVLAHIDLSGVSFEGVSLVYDDDNYLDLSHTNASFVCNWNNCFIENCNLSNGLIGLEFKRPFNSYTNCCLAGIDLSNFTIGIFDFLKCFNNVNLARTGISIKLGGISIKKLSVEDVNRLKDIIRKGYLDDCFLNGHRLLPAEDRKRKAEETRSDYATFKEKTVDVIVGLTTEYKKNKGYVKGKQ